jgi:hypothetical protein
VADEVVNVPRDLTPLGNQRLLSQLTPGVLKLLGEPLLANERAGDHPREQDAHDPDRDGHLGGVLDQGHQHGRGRREDRERHRGSERRRPQTYHEGQDRRLEHQGLELPRALREHDRGDHGDRQSEQRRAGNERPDREGGDRHRREQEVDRRRGLGDHGNQGDRERDDRHQAAEGIGLEPALA